MIVRASKLLVRALLLLVAVASLAVGVFVWRLMSGPLSVPWLTPYLERELSSPTAAVDIDDTQLRLGDDQSLDLSAMGVRVRAPDGQVLSELPEVKIALSTSALLLERRVAVTRIDAVAPTLTLTRRADGSIGFAREPSGQSAADRFDIGSMLVGFLTHSAAAGASAYLEHVRISGGELILEDQMLGRTLSARAAEMNIDSGGGGVAAELAFRIDQSAGPAYLHLSASHETGQDWIGIELALEGLVPTDFADLAPDLPLSGIHLPLSGNLQSAVSLHGERAPILFDFAAEKGVIELAQLGTGALQIDALWVQGSMAADLGGVAIDQLRLASEGAHLNGHGEVAWRGAEPTLQADLEAENATVAHVARFWPADAGREARTWVLEHITDGKVPMARAQLRFGPGELGQKPLPEHALAGEFAFEDLSVRYVDTMPALTGVSGSATFTGQRMDFTVARGHVGDLVLDHGSVVITGIGIAGRDTTQLEIAAQVAGPVDQALSLIDRPPLGFASRIGIAPDAASGRVKTDLRVGMPLHRDLEPSEEARVAADATITDGALAGKPVDLSGGQLHLTISERTAELAGEAVVHGVPLTLKVQESLGEDAGINRRYQLEGSPDVALLRQLGVDLPISLEGEVGIEATVTEAPGLRTAQIALDLTPTAIGVPQLNWRKAPGEPGSLTATATIPADGPIEVGEFTLTSVELRATGSLELQLEPLRLARLQLDQVRFGATRAVVALREGGDAGYDIQIDAQTLDLAPWLDQAGEGTDPAAPIHIGLQAERLILHGQPLRDVAADLVRGPDGWQSADLAGKLPEGGEFALTLTPDAGRQVLRLTSTDAGNLLQTLHQTRRVQGGELQLEAIIFRQQPSLHAEGKLMVRRFQLLDAPLLARLLTVASLTGIVNLFGGQGIAFEQFEVPFVVRDHVLQLEKGRLYGSQLGLTFQGRVDLLTDTLDLDGTIVPLYGINWTIGQIPIIGQLLRGSEGEGAFAATYSMRGPTDEPTISVNPLSALAPGFLRELFTGLREGTLEPPEMLPSHDK